MGSSPHTRGAHAHQQRPVVARRIIPAYAGCTLARSARRSPRRDHPRIRGVHFSISPGDTNESGSSPHTRGALGVRDVVGDSDRIIPAYAGCTENGAAVCSGWTDHPRIRGVHSLTYPVEPPVKGSSPHTRGALVKARDGAAEAGIIPAYAGCTAPTGTPAQPTSDHPRIRGVHLHAGADSTPATGSSPHTRGALHRRDVTEIRGGIIPAYAGCTCAPG